MNDATARYEQLYPQMQEVARALEVFARECLDGIAMIERVTSRAKDPDRFRAKASKLDAKAQLKYAAPLTEIQDQIGVRVIVFYLDIVPRVSTRLLHYFQSIENTQLVPESTWEFGYFGQHHVLVMPADVVPPGTDVGDMPRFFELQIKTLFQHAWSEAEHDLGYKSPNPLSGEQERLMAFAAAQAWGADHAFAGLLRELEAPESYS